MQFEFTNINTPYNQISSDVIASITKENTNSSNSNISSIYDSSDLNLDAAVLSISSKGSAKMNAMISKSIRLRVSSSDPNLTDSERLKLPNALQEIHREIEKLRTEEISQSTGTGTVAAATLKSSVLTDTLVSAEHTDTEDVDAEKLMADSKNNILKHASESIQTQVANREHILELL